MFLSVKLFLARRISYGELKLVLSSNGLTMPEDFDLEKVEKH